ncbi:MAG: hypothetical protein IPJ69_00890 [Deltaproteobacteria bacterium]|nr:MAG: hypothetical protein IPJ69_00890 [Deltaproteobacteria bacterium]
MSEAKPVPTQLFYKNLYRIGGQKMAEVLDKPLWYFKKWGYLATDIPILKETPLQHRAYQYDLTSRGFILQKYCQSHRSFQMKDYLNLTEHSISRQQALKDLQNFSWLRKKGKGKGSVYYSLLK